jgi:hypothetical protein
MGFSSSSAATYSTAAQGSGAVTSAIGAYASAQANRSQANIADTNARLSELGAQAALLQGQTEEMRSRLATANLKSTQRVSFAANGVDLGEGSSARTLTSTDLLGEVDANTIHANAVRAAFGYRTQALNYSNDALMRRAGPRGLTAGAAALLSGAGQVASSWYQFNKTGAGSSPGTGSTTPLGIYPSPQSGP